MYKPTALLTSWLRGGFFAFLFSKCFRYCFQKAFDAFCAALQMPSRNRKNFRFAFNGFFFITLLETNFSPACIFCQKSMKHVDVEPIILDAFESFLCINTEKKIICIFYWPYVEMQSFLELHKSKSTVLMSRSVKSKTGFQSITNFTMQQQTIMDLISGLRQTLLLSSRWWIFQLATFPNEKTTQKKCTGLL